MKKEIVSIVESVKSNDKIKSFDETSIKQAVVMRLLSQFGWDIFDVEEVVPDFSADSGTVDYALRVNGKNKIFISVTNAGEGLDSHQNEFLDFAFDQGAALSILTNGIAWWVYLSSVEDSVEQKKIYSTDLIEEESEESASKLEGFLDKDNIESGEAVKSAKSQYSLKKKKIASEMIPKAWIKILSGPDEALVGLIEAMTENLCDFQPDKKMITKFLAEQKENFLTQNAPDDQSEDQTEVVEKPKSKPVPKETAAPAKATPAKKKSKKAVSNYNGTFISSFSFMDKTHEVGSWDEMTTTLCKLLVGIHKEDFDKVLWSSNSNRPYFSNNSSDLRNPSRIQHAGIYVEVNLSPNDTVKLARNTLSTFEHSASDLVITLHED